MELKIKNVFYLKDKSAKNKTRINLFVTSDNGLREKVSTGISINPNEWDQDKQKSSNKAINDKLKTFIDIIETYEIDIRFKNEREFDFYELKQLLFSSQPEKQEKIVANDLFYSYIDQYYELHKNVKAYNTIKKYKSLQKFFETHFPKLRAKQINNEFAINLKAYYLEKKFLNNTISKNFQLIRVVLTWLFDTGKLQEFSLKKFSHGADGKVEEVVLELEELKRIEELNLSNKPNLESIRDYFLLASYTGTDWCDLHLLNKKNLKINSSNHKYFKFNRAKTERKSIISSPPCSLETEKILDKYKWKLEFISYDKSLQHLKTVCKLAKIDQEITLTSYSGSQKIFETRPKYDWVGWKSGRRSFITGKLLDKTSTEAVAYAVGHTKTSTTQKYHHASPDHMIDLFYK